mgnify:FL=1
MERQIFGMLPDGVDCRPRRAAYAVIHNSGGNVAAITANFRGRDEFWLPGGGIEHGESPRQTVVREVREELGRGAVVGSELGKARQFFFAGDEGCWYDMTAWFFKAEFLGEAQNDGEFALHWIDATTRHTDFFHECHAWAALLAQG